MPTHKIIWSVVAVLAITLAFSSLVDDAGRNYSDEAFKNALVTFAVSRTLNGVISVAQGTELALEPGGVGVILTLGQVLDPINDLVERFSTVMLVATSSIGLQSVLLRISAWWGMTLALTLAAGFTLLALWWPGPGLSRVAIRILLITLFLRFAVPTLVIVTSLVFDQFLAADQVAATQALETTRDQIEEINEQASVPEIEEPSFLDQLNSAFDSTLESVNLSQQLDELSARVSNSVEQIIDLIVIFIMQTILLPLGFLWLVIRILKSLGERMTRM